MDHHRGNLGRQLKKDGLGPEDDLNIDVDIINQQAKDEQHHHHHHHHPHQHLVDDDSAESKIHQIIPQYTNAAANDLSNLNLSALKGDHDVGLLTRHHHHLQSPSRLSMATGPGSDVINSVEAAIQKAASLGNGSHETQQFFITPMIEEQEFQETTTLKEFVKEFAKKNEFGIAIAHSNSKAIYFTCELGGSYREKKARKDAEAHAYATGQDPKKIGSKKIKCPFSMVANYSKKNGAWKLRITECKHNHPKLDPLQNFPMLRKRSNSVNTYIRELYSNGDKPSTIHSKLEQRFPDVMIKREDIYNEIRILKKRKLVPSNTEIKSRKLTIDDDSPHLPSEYHHHSHHHLDPHDNGANPWGFASSEALKNAKLAEFAALTVQEQAKKEAEEQAAMAAAMVDQARAAHNQEEEHVHGEGKIDENLINIDTRLMG